MKLDTDRRFAHYDAQFKSVRHEMLFAPHIEEAIVGAARGRVLDIGTGDGYKLGRILERCGAQVTGGVALEPSPLHERAAKELAWYKEVSVVHSSFEDFEPDERFDTIFLFEVIEHVPRAQQDAFLAKVTRLLAEGGTVILSTPNRPIYRMKCWLLREDRDPTHAGELNLRELRALLSQHFRDISYYGTLPWMGLVRRVPLLAKASATLNPVLVSHAFYALLRSPRREAADR